MRGFLLLLFVFLPSALLFSNPDGREYRSGMVFFDRWNTAYLFTGDGVVHLPDGQKGNLTPHNRECVVAGFDQLLPRAPFARDSYAPSYFLAGRTRAVPDRGLQLFAVNMTSAKGDIIRPYTKLIVRNLSRTPQPFDARGLSIVFVQAKAYLDQPYRGVDSGVSFAISRPLFSKNGLQTAFRFDENASMSLNGLALHLKALEPGSTELFTLSFDLDEGAYSVLVGYAPAKNGDLLLSNEVPITVESRRSLATSDLEEQ